MQPPQRQRDFDPQDVRPAGFPANGGGGHCRAPKMAAVLKRLKALQEQD